MCACRPVTGWWCRSPTATAALHPRSGKRFSSAGKRQLAKCSQNKRRLPMVFMINRRTALGGAAALTAFPAAAQDNKRIVVGTWGGDYSRLLAQNLETPLLPPQGW